MSAACWGGFEDVIVEDVRQLCISPLPRCAFEAEAERQTGSITVAVAQNRNQDCKIVAEDERK